MAAFSTLMYYLLLQLITLSSVSANTSMWKPGSLDTVTVELEFTLLSKYTKSCLKGLTPEGTNIYIDYRLIINSDVGDWIRNATSQTVSVVESTDSGRRQVELPVQLQLPQKYQHIQFQVVQLEHGGGLCNCWGLANLSISILSKTNSVPVCNLARLFVTKPRSSGSNTLNICSSSVEPLVCGGSASLPRGVVTAPYLLTAESITCDAQICEAFNGSRVSDSQPSPSPVCDTFPRIVIDSTINFLDSQGDDCRGPKRFEEGVELAVSNPNNNPGEWIPLFYFAPVKSSDTNPKNNISIYVITSSESTDVNLRGYHTKYNVSRNHEASVSLCGPQYVTDGIQLRWLQTTSLFTQTGRQPDLWILDNVSVTYHYDNHSSEVLLKSKPNGLNMVLCPKSQPANWTIRNGAFNISKCGNTDGWLMGASCTTPGCDSTGRQITVSRLVTTVRINLSNLSSNVTTTTMTVTTPTTTTEPVSFTTPTTEPTSIPTSDPEVQPLQQLERDILNAINNNSTLRELQDIINKDPAEGVERLLTVNPPSNVTVYLLSVALSRPNEINNTSEFTQNTLKLVDGLIAPSTNNNEPRTIEGSTLLMVTELLALIPENRNFSIDDFKELYFNVFDVKGEESNRFTSIDTRGSHISVPTELLKNRTTPVSVVSAHYRNMTGLLPGNLSVGDENDSILASSVVSTSLRCGEMFCDNSDIQLSLPVVITMQHNEYVKDMIERDKESEVKCVFWDFITVQDNLLASGRWSEDGCVKNNLSNSTQTVCECTHLTNFAILLSTNTIKNPVHNFALKLVGYIGVPISIVAMLCTVFALAFLKSLWNLRSFIHINLCVSLSLAQLTFVIGVTPHEGGEGVGPGCQTAAVIIHYLFLVSFMWMLMEGVVLYVALVKVFVTNTRKYVTGFLIFSYGAPLLYMVLCVPLGLVIPHESGYGYGYIQAANDSTDSTSEAVCWLNPHSNFVWSFIVPVLVVFLVNVGFLIMVLVIMYKHAKKRTLIQKVKYWLRSVISLVTIMGLTWVIGILVFEVPALLPLAYIFTIFVAFQGVAIFVLFVLLDKKVREAYSKWWMMRFGKYFENLSFTRSTSDTDAKSNDATSPWPTAPNTSAPHILEPSVMIGSTSSDTLATTKCSNYNLSDSAVDIDIDTSKDQSSNSVKFKEHGLEIKSGESPF